MMPNSYRTLCDDFYLDMYVNTELELPNQRDTILTFFERLQRQFPQMSHFCRRRRNQYCLEENHSTGQYRWVTLEIDRIGSGMVNPANFEDAYAQHRLVLELAPYMLSLSHLDIASLDVTFGMDFDYYGNHDELIAEALGCGAFDCLLDLPQARAVGFSPTMVVALSSDHLTQARITVESKTGLYGWARKEQLEDEAISLTLLIRQYPGTDEKFDPLKSFQHQCRLAEELMAETVVPNVVKPLTEVIAQKRLG